MDLLGFASDFLAGLLGTMIGLFAGLRLDARRRRRDDEAADLQTLRDVFDRLAGKRAFSHSESVGLLDEPLDMERCAKSILDARDRLARTSAALKVNVEALPPLRQMESDCAAYLSYIEWEPQRYAIAALRLRDKLYEQELEVARVVPNLEVRKPGDGNAGSIDWLMS